MNAAHLFTPIKTLSRVHMTTAPYQLAENVFLCLSDNRIVFLDLGRNQYLCLNQHNTQVAIRLFTGSTRLGEELQTEDRVTDSENTRLVVQALTDRGIIVQGGTNGKEATSVRVKAPEHVLLTEEIGRMSTVRIHHLPAFLHASLKASWKLHWYSLQRTVRSIENRKQRCVKPRTTDHDALRELVAIFHHLRPYYAREYQCLFDSLALVEFLAHYRLFPQWVYGVAAEPFAAHCWVQENDCILNDTVEYVRGFTPIMAV